MTQVRNSSESASANVTLQNEMLTILEDTEKRQRTELIENAHKYEEQRQNMVTRMSEERKMHSATELELERLKEQVSQYHKEAQKVKDAMKEHDRQFAELQTQYMKLLEDKKPAKEEVSEKSSVIAVKG